MPKFESELQISSLKSASTTNAGVRFSSSSNNLVLHVGDDNRVGIGTDRPEATLHVDGTLIATGLIVPPGTISSASDTAKFWGFNPLFDEWDGAVANGYTQTGTGVVEQSSDAVLGGSSARFKGTEDVVWSRKVIFAEPLFANVFFQGSYSYKYESYTSGEPGLAITLEHRPTACNDSSKVYSNTFISPTHPTHNTGTWQTALWRAITPPGREITSLQIDIVSSAAQKYDSTASDSVELSSGSGNATFLGGSSPSYDWYVDGLSFNFFHPDMRVDQEGRITGTYIENDTIGHIKINSINASSITTGTLDVDTTVRVGTTNRIASQGENLIHDPDFENTTWFFPNNATSVSSDSAYSIARVPTGDGYYSGSYGSSGVHSIVDQTAGRIGLASRFVIADNDGRSPTGRSIQYYPKDPGSPAPGSYIVFNGPWQDDTAPPGKRIGDYHASMTEGEKFYAEVYAKSNASPTSISVNFNLFFSGYNPSNRNLQVDENNGILNITSGNISLTDQYQKISVTGTAPANTNFGYAWVDLKGSATISEYVSITEPKLVRTNNINNDISIGAEGTILLDGLNSRIVISD